MEYFQREIETMSRTDIARLQTDRLKTIVNYCYEKVPMYRNKFDSIGLKPSHIQSLKDIELIPFTTKDDFRDHYPFGMFAVPMRDILRLHASSGTTGKSTVVGYTRRDMDTWSDVVARFLIASGSSQDEVVQIAFGYGLFTGGFGLHQVYQKIGAAVIPISSGNTERQITIMRDFMPTALVSTPSYALYMAETLYSMGFSHKDISLKRGFFGAEASTQETHEQLMQLFNITTNDNYGLSEIIGPGVSGECLHKTGMHIAEDHFYPEIVDRDTFKPLSEGETGELVVTTLTKEGMPILRYRTKDLTSLDLSTCTCGRTMARMKKIIGRTDDMLIIRGVNIFPSQIEAVLMGIGDVANNYSIIVDRINHLDTLEVLVEVMDGALLTDYFKLEKLREKVFLKLKSALQIEVKVRLVEPSSLKRYEGKAKRVTDNRKDKN